MTTPFFKAADIAAYIESRLAEITILNGYSTDIGLNVYPGRLKIDDEQVPCSVIIEGEDVVGQVSGDEVKLTQNYVLGGYVQCDPQRPNDAAHLVLRDLKRAIFRPDTSGDRPLAISGFRLGGRVIKVNYLGRDIGPRADGVAIVFSLIRISVEYVEKLSDA